MTYCTCACGRCISPSVALGTLITGFSSRASAWRIAGHVAALTDVATWCVWAVGLGPVLTGRLLLTAFVLIHTNPAVLLIAISTVFAVPGSRTSTVLITSSRALLAHCSVLVLVGSLVKESRWASRTGLACIAVVTRTSAFALSVTIAFALALTTAWPGCPTRALCALFAKCAISATYWRGNIQKHTHTGASGYEKLRETLCYWEAKLGWRLERVMQPRQQTGNHSNRGEGTRTATGKGYVRLRTTVLPWLFVPFLGIVPTFYSLHAKPQVEVRVLFLLLEPPSLEQFFMLFQYVLTLQKKTVHVKDN